MSKIKINEIESVNTNDDLVVTPTGTNGALEVSNDDDLQSSIQFNDSLEENKVKVKGPVHTANQDYTLVLPATNITADKFLKVESITGSGSTATAQLGYHTFTPADENNLVGSSFTSGSVPASRYNLAGTVGGGLKLVQKQVITQAQEHTIQKLAFTGLKDNTMYKILIGNYETASPDTSSTQGGLKLKFLDNTYDGTTGYLGNIFQYNGLYYDLPSQAYPVQDTNPSVYELEPGGSTEHLSYIMEFYNAAPTVSNQSKTFLMIRAVSAPYGYGHLRTYISFKEFASTSSDFVRAHGLEFRVQYNSLGNVNYYFNVGCEFALYEYDAT